VAEHGFELTDGEERAALRSILTGDGPDFGRVAVARAALLNMGAMSFLESVARSAPPSVPSQVVSEPAMPATIEPSLEDALPPQDFDESDVADVEFQEAEELAWEAEANDWSPLREAQA